MCWYWWGWVGGWCGAIIHRWGRPSHMIEDDQCQTGKVRDMPSHSVPFYSLKTTDSQPVRLSVCHGAAPRCGSWSLCHASSLSQMPLCLMPPPRPAHLSHRSSAFHSAFVCGTLTPRPLSSWLACLHGPWWQWSLQAVFLNIFLSAGALWHEGPPTICLIWDARSTFTCPRARVRACLSGPCSRVRRPISSPDKMLCCSHLSIAWGLFYLITLPKQDTFPTRGKDISLIKTWTFRKEKKTRAFSVSFLIF